MYQSVKLTLEKMSYEESVEILAINIAVFVAAA